jgi:hypothetical protein
LNEAIQLAAKFPPARVDSIEVRPVGNCSFEETPALSQYLQKICNESVESAVG